MVGEYIESIRRIPFSRRHDWSRWVEAISKRVSAEEVEYPYIKAGLHPGFFNIIFS